MYSTAVTYLYPTVRYRTVHRRLLWSPRTTKCPAMGWSNDPRIVASQQPNFRAVDAWFLEKRSGMTLNSCWIEYLQQLFENLEWSAWDIPTKELPDSEFEDYREVWFGIFRACKYLRHKETGELTSAIMISKCVAWAMTPTQVCIVSIRSLELSRSILHRMGV